MKALLQTLLDAPEAEELDLMALADFICERKSIGTVIASALEPEQDPELRPELQKLDEAGFEKAALKFLCQRDIYGFSTILSLNYF